MEEARQLGLRLRNLLKHRNAHRWVYYEFFYANIDRTLLGGDNDFRACLKESFPHLKAKNLTKAEWRKIRRSLGKHRRFSQVFVSEQRALLGNKRQKIRQLQQQKVVDVSYYKDLPEQIPLSLVIGTRVTALLHEPQFGLFNGIIDAVDTKSHGYRVTFDRKDVGTHTVPDYEVLSVDPPEFLPLCSFHTRIKPRRPILKSPKFLEILGQQVTEALANRTDASSNQQTFVPDNNEESGGGQYPIKLLALLVRVSKILSMKKKRIYELKSMNDEVERLQSLERRVPLELKRTYASTILDLEKLNSDLDDHLKAVQIYSNELSIDSNCIPDPDLIKQKCMSEAKDIIDNLLPNYEIFSKESISIITHMITLMFHLKSISESDDSSLQLKALSETIHEYKTKLPLDEIPNYLMPSDKTKASMSQSGRMATKDAFKALGLPRSASIDEINQSFKTKLADIQTRNADKPDKLVQDADALYAAYRAAYLSKDAASEDQMLPLTITGPDSMLNMFGISDLPHQSLKVQMSSQAQYKDGQLVKQESNKTETFVNKDGKRETRVYENGRLIKHTIDGRDVLNK